MSENGGMTDPALVEIQRRLARVDDSPAMLADMVIAVALRTGKSPRQVLAMIGEGYPITEEEWATIRDDLIRRIPELQGGE